MLTNDWTSIFFLIAFKYTAHQRTENDLVTAESQLVTNCALSSVISWSAV